MGHYALSVTIPANICGEFTVTAGLVVGDTAIVAPDYGGTSAGTVPASVVSLPGRQVDVGGSLIGNVCNVSTAPVTLTNGRFDIWAVFGPAGPHLLAASLKGGRLSAAMVDTSG